MKKFGLFLLVVALIVGGAVACTSKGGTSGKEISVTISISERDGGTVVLPETEVKTTEGENVLNVLKKVTAEANIEIRLEKSSYFGDYLTGVGGLNAGTGENGTFGWIYKVDGEAPQVGMGDCKLSGGEKIEVLYISVDLADA